MVKWGSMHSEGGMCGEGGHTWQKGVCVCGGGMCGREACMAGGHVWQGACIAGETATAVDGTHPTGMYSFLQLILKCNKEFV